MLPPALPVYVPHGEALREAEREAHARLVLCGFQCVHNGVVSVMSGLMKPFREPLLCSINMGMTVSVQGVLNVLVVACD
jgi:hypothetical protein